MLRLMIVDDEKPRSPADRRTGRVEPDLSQLPFRERDGAEYQRVHHASAHREGKGAPPGSPHENTGSCPPGGLPGRRLFFDPLQEARGTNALGVPVRGVSGVSMFLRRFHDLSIRHKLFTSFFSLVMFFLCLFLVINTLLATRENESQALRSARRVFGQTRAPTSSTRPNRSATCCTSSRTTPPSRSSSSAARSTTCRRSAGGRSIPSRWRRSSIRPASIRTSRGSAST
jgi:hypothetical protein